MIKSGFVDMILNNFFAFTGFMGIDFCKNSLIGALFWYFRTYGYDFRKFSRFMIILLRNFSRFMGGSFMS